MMKDIVSKKIFGATKAHCYTIEFQKRGLPHAHILLWLEVQPNETTFDDYVCAEIPDDRAILESGEDIDEVKQCMEGRYISSHEVCWRVLGFETKGFSHNIVGLPAYLPNQQYVTFHAARPIETALQNYEQTTMLTEFFKVNLDIQ
jgi:Helitron helicase-like domain at N-terminus